MIQPLAFRPDRTLLVVEGLTKTFPPRAARREPFTANDHLDLVVRSGEIVALLGPNGAGKSTFLKQVAGQLLPSAGRIWVAGIDMVARPRAAKDHIAVIPQECTPLESLTVEEHVRYFGRLKARRREMSDGGIAAILREVGLEEERQKLVRELSGGYKRRVLIATAIAGESPELLLLDEPTTGLDPEGRRSVWRIVEGLRKEGRGVLLTTHYIEEAEYLADRVIIITGGRFVATGTVDEVRGRFRFHGRIDVRELDRLPRDGRAALDRLSESWPVILRTDSHLRLGVSDPFSSETVAVLAQLTALNVRASLAPASLEDAYLQLVGEETGNGR